MATTLEMYGGIQTVQVNYIHVQNVRLCDTSHHIKPSHVKLERVIAVCTAKSRYIQSHVTKSHESVIISSSQATYTYIKTYGILLDQTIDII